MCIGFLRRFMANVEQTKLGNLYPRTVFEIPRYQRGYAWGERQVSDLLEDLEYAHNEWQAGNDDFTHYFGTIVLHDTGTEQGETQNYDSYNLIDGQQRISTIPIIVRCINDEIRRIIDFPLDESYSVPPEKMAQENRADFISHHGSIRIRLDSINNETFEELVVHGGEVNQNTRENIAQRRLVEAKETVQNWLDEQREHFVDESLDYDSYYVFLRELGRIIRDGLEVTTYVIQDETEAGRLFEVVNDRGKDLTTLDRIKSYLVYCSARQDDIELSRKVYRKMGEVIRNITERGGSDDDLETFVNHHWIIFTGEINRFRRDTEYKEIHRRIKHLKKHASQNQTKESVRKWINAYLESITAYSEAYSKIKNPDLFDVTSSTDIDGIVDKITAINELPISTNFYPLLMATYRNFGISKEFHNMVTLCEIFSVRVYNIAGRRTDAAGNPLRRHAYWMEWANERERASEIFSSEQVALRHDSLKEGFKATCQMLESQIGKHCPDSFFINCLLRDDILDGSDANDGWTGVRNKHAISYILYKYEKYLRDSGSQSAISQIPPFSQWKKEGITIEHIYPQNPDEENLVEELESVKNSLGNLVLLGPEDNSGAGNGTYSDKYDRVYSTSTMKMVDELPKPENGWNGEDVKQRARKIAKFALKEWGNMSTARVHVSNALNGLKKTQLTSVAHDVRLDYSKYGFRVPSVHFKTENTGSNGNWEIVNSCPECDSTLVNLHSTKGWDAECGGCGQILKKPVYKFKSSQYIEG
jgi:uncharacterized protein with ParB-like and HNH nuclease domain/ribosomal protein L37AE/L43A